MAAQLYNAPGEWSNYRRGTDFYDEGVLLWLEVDTVIRQQSGGAKSIEDFVRAFHGAPSSAPMVKPYTFDDVVSALNAVAPYDWRSFFTQRLTSTSPHADLAGIENAGWRVQYDETPNTYIKAGESSGKSLDLRFSLGATLDEAGKVGDVVMGSPVDKAGVSPGMTIVAVNGRKYSDHVIRDAIKAAKGTATPVELLLVNGEFYSTAKVDYHDGERYPHLVRVDAKPDLLTQIASPLVK
jgi:predicted metalloprotease with PDZ domain